jgi:hypothetical protein
MLSNYWHFVIEKTSSLVIDSSKYLVQVLCFWTLSIVLSLSKTVLFIFKTQRFGDQILSPSSGKTYSVGPNQ